MLPVIAKGAQALATVTEAQGKRSMGRGGKLDVTLGANYNATKVINSRLGALFNLQSQAIIEQSSPKFKSVLGMDSIMVGFALDDDRVHSPNEKFKLENYYIGIKTIAQFLERYGQKS